jgi:hypothetical protein
MLPDSRANYRPVDASRAVRDCGATTRPVDALGGVLRIALWTASDISPSDRQACLPRLGRHGCPQTDQLGQVARNVTTGVTTDTRNPAGSQGIYVSFEPLRGHSAQNPWESGTLTRRFPRDFFVGRSVPIQVAAVSAPD